VVAVGELAEEVFTGDNSYFDHAGPKGIPLTNILAPNARGSSNAVAFNASAEGQAENRRVVVRVLQNKGIAGTGIWLLN